MPATVIVIPAYQEAATIEALVARARRVADAVIVVDDGSSDRTGDLAHAAGAVVLRHLRNQGKGNSLLAGMRLALRQGAERVVTLDGDGQHCPEDLPRFLATASAHPDAIVLGSRRTSQNMKLARDARLGSRTAESVPGNRRAANLVADFWISWAAGRPIEDSQCGFRLYPRAALEGLALERRRGRHFVLESELLIDAARRGLPVIGVPIAALYDASLHRRSHFRPVVDITRIVSMMAGKLLLRGMYPQGLWRVRRARRAAAAATRTLAGSSS